MTRHGRLTRRRFLKTAGPTALAVPLVVDSSALGLDGGTGANGRITLGYIGVGKRGRAHHLALGNRPDCQTLALCDVNRSRIEHFASRNVTLHADFRELLARDDLDAVVISTPDHWHAIQTIEAAEAGKDVYCETPLSLTIGEARAMADAVRRHDRVLQTGSQQRSIREVRFACEMVRSGRIGRLKSVDVSVGGPSGDCCLPEEPVPEGVDWDMWLGPAPWRPCHRSLLYGGFRPYRDYSGGGMTEWGAHQFDVAQWAMGTDDTGPVKVFPPDGRDVRRLTFRYANGVTVTCGGPPAGGVVFKGTEGKVAVAGGRFRTWPASLTRKPIGSNEVHLRESPGHHEDWLRAIRRRERPICDAQIGCRSVTVCHLGNLACWLKRPLEWDPIAEKFVGDPEANRWLDRPKRDPWT